jgi:membrane associated rhomboid family serine protease
MLPLGDDNSDRRIIPFVTYALIAINVLVFVLLELPQGDNLEAFLTRWGTIPAQIVAGNGLITLITSMFLHANFMHIASNMLFLWIFGDNVEDAFGHVLYLIFYLVSGIVGALAQVFVYASSTVPGIGASAAIAGVLAGYIVLFGSRPVRVLMRGVLTTVPSYVMIGLWIVTQVLAGFGSLGSGESGGVGYWAHIGGFVGGLVLTFLLRGFARPQLASAPDRRSLLR